MKFKKSAKLKVKIKTFTKTGIINTTKIIQRNGKPLKAQQLPDLQERVPYEEQEEEHQNIDNIDFDVGLDVDMPITIPQDILDRENVQSNVNHEREVCLFLKIFTLFLRICRAFLLFLFHGFGKIIMMAVAFQ